MFVADINEYIYHFDLNENRTGLHLEDDLIDGVANSDGELDEIVFAEGFGGVTDLDVGPDGYLYVIDYREGALYIG